MLKSVRFPLLHTRMMKRFALLIAFCATFCLAHQLHAQDTPALTASVDAAGDNILIHRGGTAEPILTQAARADFRPYLHPIVAPDGNGVLTEFSPGHHKHQTGLYWGFTRVNGRDYFHHPEASHWKRVSASVLTAEAATSSDSVQWQTVYDLLDEEGNAVLRQSQIWTMRDSGDRYLIDLEWTGEALVDVTIGEYDYGGLVSADAVEARDHRSCFQQRSTGRSPCRGTASCLDRRRHARSMAATTWLTLPSSTIHKTTDSLNLGESTLKWALVRCVPASVTGRSTRARKKPSGTNLSSSRRALDDVALTEQWSAYSGQGMAWAQWRLAQEEGRSAEFLTPEKAVESMTLQDGFQANVYASEPMMTQPMAFCWDSKGRMWIAENRDYETRQSGFSNDGNSRILILEDTDHDGVADNRKVFLEGIPFPAGIAVGMGGLWLGAPPNLLFVPDRDGDDKADMDDIEVRLTGWGIRDRHETLNSFIWGPDGWLYGCQGFATPSRVGKPAGKGKLYKHSDPFPERDRVRRPEPVDINGGVWRYHPTKDRFEVVAHGFSNPWGIDYDAQGQLLITACVIPHLWHVIPGGIYHRQGGSHFNRYVYSDIRTIADHRHRSAHGGARVYLSDALPQQYKGRIFMANIHEHAVLTDILEPKGSGFVGHHGDDFRAGQQCAVDRLQYRNRSRGCDLRARLARRRHLRQRGAEQGNRSNLPHHGQEF